MDGLHSRSQNLRANNEILKCKQALGLSYTQGPEDHFSHTLQGPGCREEGARNLAQKSQPRCCKDVRFLGELDTPSQSSAVSLQEPNSCNRNSGGYKSPTLKSPQTTLPLCDGWVGSLRASSSGVCGTMFCQRKTRKETKATFNTTCNKNNSHPLLSTALNQALCWKFLH